MIKDSACVLSCFSRVPLFVTLWTIAQQTPLSIGLSRQEYRSGLPCPPSGDRPNLGIKTASLTSPDLQVNYLSLLPLGKPQSRRGVDNLDWALPRLPCHPSCLQAAPKCKEAGSSLSSTTSETEKAEGSSSPWISLLSPRGLAFLGQHDGWGSVDFTTKQSEFISRHSYSPYIGLLGLQHQSTMTGSLTQQTIIFSQHWRLQVQNQGVGRGGSFWNLFLSLSMATFSLCPPVMTLQMGWQRREREAGVPLLLASTRLL